MRFLFLTAFGLLPLWVAIGVVIFFAFRSGSESLNVTPWAIIFSIPASALTLLVAFGTVKLHSYIDGDQPRKLLGSTVALLGVVFLVALVIWTYQAREKKRSTYINMESVQAANFLMSNETVVNTVGDVSKVSLITFAVPHSGWLPTRYSFSIHGSKPATAEVKVNRQGSVPQFVLTDVSSRE